MGEQLLMVAFLADNLFQARHAIQTDWNFCRALGPDRGTVLDTEGNEVPFRIILFEDQLVGLLLSDFFVIGRVNPKLEAIARMRVRVTDQPRIACRARANPQ